jgi:hypothetical protein
MRGEKSTPLVPGRQSSGLEMNRGDVGTARRLLATGLHDRPRREREVEEIGRYLLPLMP